MNEKKSKYSGVSIPMGILEEIDRLIEELRYWPSRSAFVREACLEKIREEKQRLRELKSAQPGGLKKGSAPEKAGDVTNRRSDDSSPKIRRKQENANK